MTRWIGRIAAVLFLGGVAGHGALAAAPGPTGQWVVEDGKAAVDLEPCGDKLCGKIAWLKIPLNDQGKPKTDIHDGDSALQTRPLCGLLMLWDFTLNEDGRAAKSMTLSMGMFIAVPCIYRTMGDCGFADILEFRYLENRRFGRGRLQRCRIVEFGSACMMILARNAKRRDLLF